MFTPSFCSHLTGEMGNSLSRTAQSISPEASAGFLSTLRPLSFCWERDSHPIREVVPVFSHGGPGSIPTVNVAFGFKLRALPH